MKYFQTYEVFESINSYHNGLDQSIKTFDDAAGSSDPSLASVDPDDPKEVKAKRVKADMEKNPDPSNKIIWSPRKKRTDRNRRRHLRKMKKLQNKK